MRRGGIEHVVDRQRQGQLVVDVVRDRSIGGQVALDPAVFVVVRQAADIVAVDIERPRLVLEVDAERRLVARHVIVGIVGQLRQLIVTGVADVGVVQDVGVVARQDELTDRCRHADVRRDIDARGRFLRDVDRVDDDVTDVAGAVAHNARNSVDAGRRRRVLVAQAAFGFVAQDRIDVQVFDFARHVDLEVVGRDVEHARRRPDEAGIERLARFGLQRLGATGLHLEARVVAVAGIGFGVGAQALIIVGIAAFDITYALIDVVEVRRPEAGAVGGTQQQGLERPVFEAEIVGRLTDIVTGIVEVVVTACQAGLDLRRDRSAEFKPGRPVGAVALTRRVDPAEVIGLGRLRVGAEVVILAAGFDDGRETDRTGRQVEQVGGLDLGRQGADRALGLIDAVLGDRSVFRRRQRRIEARRIGVEDRQA